MLQRPRRNRRTETIRSAVRETRLHTDQLVQPLFVVEGREVQYPIASMPGQFRWSRDLLLEEIGQCLEAGIRSFALFPAVDAAHKDRKASYAHASGNFYLKTIRAVKELYPEVLLIGDVAMDPYSKDGHDGLVGPDGRVLNDETLPILAQMAVAQAQAGIDWIGPSDMMDGRVRYLREALDAKGFADVGIMSYTAKYASAFYGPFRDALDSAPKAGDKKTYQMDPANVREALREAELDAAEGADCLLVKPALAYLDVIRALRERHSLPIAAYHVSGEYAMLMAAAKEGWLELEPAVEEMLTAIRRAGADLILTYFAKPYARMVRQRGDWG
jgi:porphobilinogen synthase